MKVVALLVVIVSLFSASQAVELDLDSLKAIGQSLLDTAVEKGKQLLTDLAQKALGSLIGQIGKRDAHPFHQFITELAEKFSTLLDDGKTLASAVFKQTLDKLKKVTDYFHKAIGTLENSKPVEDAIDAIVEEHHVMQKRVIGELLQKGSDILASLADKVKGAVADVKATASKIVGGLLQKGVDILGPGVLGKRALVDHLKTIGDAISDAVSPFKDTVKNLGNTLKGHFNNLVDTVKGHANALGEKLKPHLDDLKDHGKKLAEHGKNALGALSEVFADILKQTLDNAKPSVDGIKDTISDAVKTVGDHVAGY